MVAEEKAILNSVIDSTTKHFTDIASVTAELSARHSRQTVTEIDGKKCKISASGILDTEAGSFRFRELGYGQMLGMLGIPRGYADRIPNDLLQHDINRLFLEKGRRTKIVRDGDQIRGFMPATRTCVPNIPLVRHLEASFQETGLILSQAELSDSVLRTKFLSPSLKIELPHVGDIYSVGIDVCNSDVGATALAADAFTLCLKCTNGAVAPRDIWGIRKSRFGKGVDASNMLASFIMDVNGIVTKLDRMQTCLQKSMELKATQEQLAVYERVVGDVILDVEQAKTAMGQFSLESSVYQVQYAITQLSQKIEDVLARRRVEALAGRMIFGDLRQIVELSKN